MMYPPSSGNSTSTAANDEAAQATPDAPKPCGASNRRQLLLRSAGLAASAAVPVSIGGLGLVATNEAQAAGTADGMRILWQEGGDPTVSDDETIRRVSRRALAFDNNTFYSGSYVLVTMRGFIYNTRWADFDIRSSAGMYFDPHLKQWTVRFHQRGKLTFTGTRDSLLNPDTCDAPWSKEDDNYQHRSLNDNPGDGRPLLTDAQVRQRRVKGILHNFNRFMTTIYGRANNQGQVRVINYVNAQQQIDRDNGLPVREASTILADRFNVEFRVSSITGNEPPSFFNATITDRHDPSQPPFYMDMIRVIRSNADDTGLDSSSITYRTLVTQRIGDRTVMPMQDRFRQPINPPTYSIAAAENRYENEIIDRLQEIEDDEVKASLFNAMTTLLEAGVSALTSFNAAPFALAAAVFAQSDFPAKGHVARISLTNTLIAAPTLLFLVTRSIEIYNYFNGEEGNFIKDVIAGWGWKSYDYDDNNEADRRLIGYTHDVDTGEMIPIAPPLLTGTSIGYAIDGIAISPLPTKLVKGVKVTVHFNSKDGKLHAGSRVFTIGTPAPQTVGGINGAAFKSWATFVNGIYTIHAIANFDSYNVPWTIKTNLADGITARVRLAGGTTTNMVPSAADNEFLPVRFYVPRGGFSDYNFIVGDGAINTGLIASLQKKLVIEGAANNANRTYRISARLV